MKIFLVLMLVGGCLATVVWLAGIVRLKELGLVPDSYRPFILLAFLLGSLGLFLAASAMIDRGLR